ncbi:hypothetical protein BCR44DRAFT_121657 [Catenaria anguillulae PL171]|uniref:Cytochrome b5 heme-binding domain-containing protein n=1 Tax=Catenaria anguillulae PL171 TaxID=765915 RepID=A0A1Y2I5J4_9FUNG|nr:hypothetical protein BCR44DRAFT_121657 [Catenaria anguillulae PL171]
MIWSYSIVGSREITFHGSNRGTVTVNFFTGASAQRASVIELTGVLLAHAIMMFTAFGFLMPLAVAIARYLRTCEGWVMGHVGLQVLATLMAIIAGALSISVTQLGNSAHGVVGLCLYSLILLQLLIGFTNLRRLLFGSRSKWIKYIKLVHNNLGRFILAVAVFNIPLAINLVHPTNQSGSLGMPWWIAYFVVASLWLMFFGVMETKRILHAAKLKGAGGTGSLPRANVMGITKANTKQVAAEQIVIERDDLPLVSWRDVDEEVVKGKRWVVGNGFVYDIETWIFNHPGGQAVLYNVLGTDISSDFFNNSGYDMDLFTPWADRPDFDEAPPASQQDGAVMNRMSVVSAAPSDASGIYNRDVEADPRILKEDWKMIMRARNQHFHSPEAIGKLKKLVVAKLDVACQNQFTKDEYRRYALTSKELLSSAGADAEVYRLKFCLLFPNELYEEDPLFLFPGQAIELQLRVRGQFVSRYYTPCSGNMAVFDMIAKCLPDGVMSNVFRQTRPGELQWKIRGPFGSPLINIERPLPMHNGCWDEVLCIGVGSGMTPHLQMLSWYFMQTTFSLRPAADNVPTKASELAVKRSHKVFLRHPLQNGWVFATNADTAQDGIIHLSKLTPWIGRQAKVTVVNAARNIASLIGTDMLEAVRAAYPDQLSLEYVLTREAPSPATANGGQVRYHTCRVDRQFLASLLERKKWIQQGESGRSQRVVLCGPEKFMQLTYTTLVELGVPEDDVISLPAHSYLVNPHWSWTPIKYTGSQSGNKSSASSTTTTGTRPARIDSLPPAGQYKSSDANSTSSSFSSMSSSRTAVPPSAGGAGYDGGDSFFHGGGEAGGGEFMSETEYAAALPPSLPVRVDPRNNEPQWFFLPQETIPRQSSMDRRQ